MKKFTCLLMAIIFTVAFATMAFAAPGDVEIPDSNAPGAADTTTEDTYGTVDITDEGTPEGGNTGSSDEIVPVEESITDDLTPQSGTLAKTGGIPAEAFYAIGGLCIVSALVLSRKKSGESKAN